MILIRFPDADAERRALGFLAGRFSFKSRSSEETSVPENALAYLAAENIPFCVEGQAPHDPSVSAVRTSPAEKI